MLRCYLSLLLCFCIGLCFDGSTAIAKNRNFRPKTPDFAYPKTVIQDAEQQLDQALQVGNGDLVVDALVRYALAQTSISEEKTDEVCQKIESVRQREQKKGHHDIVALLQHLELRMLDRFPAFFSKRDQYQARYDSLFDASLSRLDDLGRYPVGLYPTTIQALDAEGTRIVPTLAEFLILQSCDLNHLFSAERAARLDSLVKTRLQPIVDFEKREEFLINEHNEDRQYASATIQGIVNSKDSIRIAVRYRNLSGEFRLSFYSHDNQLNNDKARDFLVKEYKFPVPDTTRRKDLCTQVTIPPLPYGRYVMTTGFTGYDGKFKQGALRDRWGSITVTDIQYINISYEPDTLFTPLTVDRMTGHPIAQRDEADQWLQKLSTPSFRSFGYWRDTLYSLSVLTDLGVYRPGERVQYTGFYLAKTLADKWLLADRKVQIRLMNPDDKEVGIDTLTTDAYGQFAGAFDLPQEGRTGTFYLDMKDLSPTRSRRSTGIDRNFFEVSEYKLPTFGIDFDGQRRRFSPLDSLFSFTGHALGFSGMPKARQQVRIEVAHIDTTITTDAQGTFTFALERKKIMPNPSDRWYWGRLSATLTDDAGETQSGSVYFSVSGDEEEIKTTTPPVRLTPADITADMIPADTVMWIHDIFIHQQVDNPALTSSPKTARGKAARPMASLLIGTSTPDAYIYYIVQDRVHVLDQGWLHYKETGLHRFEYPMPLGNDARLTATFIATQRGNTTYKNCTFSLRQDPTTSHLSLVTFRDRIVPGTRETWSFRHELPYAKRTAPSRYIFDLYDYAIDRIADGTWQLNFGPRNAPNADIEFFSPWPYSDYTSDNRELVLPKKPDYPIWNFYDREFYEVQPTRYALSAGGPNAIQSVLRKTENRADLLEDSGVAAEEEVADMVIGYSGEKNTDQTASQTRSDGVLADINVRGERKNVAMWMPRLTSDEEGRISLTFDVPDQNTTWRLQGVSVTPDALLATFDTLILAQRPLMVQPSLPRFVRQGDRLSLSGLVQNATASPITATAHVEVFDPRSRQTIASHSQEIQLDPLREASVEVEITVPDTLQQMAYRIRAIANEGSIRGSGDGEQRLVPVLPALSPVVETIPFYLNPGDAAQTIVLPDSLPQGARIELEWCENPVVYCLEALPSLMTETGFPTASSLAHRLFAYAVSERIVHRYPAEMADTILNKLAFLQNGDGGFSWIDYPQRKSSPWVTSEVLEILGELHRLQAYTLPEPMTGLALMYFDQFYVEQWEKARKENGKKQPFDAAAYTHFLYIHSLFPEHKMSAPALKLYKTALEQSRKRWGEMGLADRAFLALALWHAGDNPQLKVHTPQLERQALAIVESLRQFSLTHPRRGMYWDQLQHAGYRWMSRVTLTSLMLQAFARTGSEPSEIDLIRKWLLLEKQTSHWGHSSMAADAIYALLSTGSEWMSKEQIAQRVAGRDSVADRLFDRDTLSILRELPSSTRSVEIPAAAKDHPSWGAIYMHYAAPTRTAKAAANEEISIRKELIVDGRILADDAPLRVGDKVTIRLTVTTTRDMNELMITDERAACLEPRNQLSGYHWSSDAIYYLEPLDQRSRIFIPRLRRGENRITYDLYVTSPGEFALGLASVQCQYAPMFNAHSEGRVIRVE